MSVQLNLRKFDIGAASSSQYLAKIVVKMSIAIHIPSDTRSLQIMNVFSLCKTTWVYSSFTNGTIIEVFHLPKRGYQS